MITQNLKTKVSAFDWDNLIPIFVIFSALLMVYLTFPAFMEFIQPNEQFDLWESPLKPKHGGFLLLGMVSLALLSLISSITKSMWKNESSFDLKFWIVFGLFIIKILTISFLIFGLVFEASMSVFDYFSIESTIALIVSLSLGLIAVKKFG